MRKSYVVLFTRSRKDRATTMQHQLLIFVILLLTTLQVVDSIREQCQKDCQATGCPLTHSSATRLLGPTRPFDYYDTLSNELSLTRPYPYAVMAMEITSVTILIKLFVHISGSNVGFSETIVLTTEEKLCIVSTVSCTVSKFQCEYATLQYNESDIKNGNLILFPISVELQLRYQDTEMRSHKKYLNTTATIKEWFQSSVAPILTSHLNMNETTNNHLHACVNENLSNQTSKRIIGLSIPSHKGKEESAITFYNHTEKLAAPRPNPYSRFCEVGCSLFYANTTEEPTEIAAASISLRDCMILCDYMYYYNLTLGYSDLMEVARLECHDGCFIGLQRCQPGYYCIQPIIAQHASKSSGIGVEEDPKLEATSWKEGMMNPCPPGTYRETSNECLSCPPGSYRNKYLGTGLNSCIKCPVGTYAPNFRSKSILDCVRCPAGICP